MEKLSQTILNKVKMEAQSIIREAEEKAQEEIEKAKKQRQEKFAEERSKLIQEAEEEAARILAQASIKARQQVSSAKAEVVAKIVDAARSELSRTSGDQSLLNLVREALEGLGVDKARIYVSPKDIISVKKYLEADKELSAKIIEVSESNCLGGVIVEDIEGKRRIDNTYETRLEMLLPKLLPEISKELFEAR